MTLIDLLAPLLAYALGCVSGGYYLVRWRSGEDLRRHGSGSLGGTNAARCLGRWAFVVVVLVDLGKGLLAVLLARRLGASEAAQVAAAFAAVLGHVHPLQLGLRGGKGVATSVGAWMLLAPQAFAVVATVGLPAFLLSRRKSSSAMLGYVAAALLLWPMTRAPMPSLGFAATTVLVLVAHRDNLRRELRRGKEGVEA